MLTLIRRILHIFNWTRLPPLRKNSVTNDPFRLFADWFRNAKKYEYFDASAMTLTTVTAKNSPSGDHAVPRAIPVGKVDGLDNLTSVFTLR